MAERYLGHEMLVVGPGIRTGMPLRYDNPREIGADRLVNAVAAYDKVGGACIVVDFGTAITYDPVSAEGEYLGGIISPGVEISLEALTSRAAKLPKIDLLPPRSLIGKTTVDAIRSGIVYGFAGQVDAIVRRLRDELGEETETIATGGLAAAHRAVHGDDRRGRRPAHAQRAAAAAPAQPLRAATLRSVLPALTDSWRIGSVEIPNRVVLAPLAGIGNWFVRLQAKRHGAGLAVSEMVSSFAIHYRNERTCTELLRIDDAERDGGPGVDPALRPGPGRHAVGRRDAWPSAAPTSSTSTWAARFRRSARPGAGRRADQGPGHGRGGRSRRARGQRPAGHGEAALRPAPRGDPTATTSPTGSSRRRAWPRSRSIPARPRCTTRACPTTTSPRGWCESLPAPVILTGGMGDAGRGRRRVRAHRAPRP